MKFKILNLNLHFVERKWFSIWDHSLELSRQIQIIIGFQRLIWEPNAACTIFEFFILFRTILFIRYTFVLIEMNGRQCETILTEWTEQNIIQINPKFTNKEIINT